MESAEQFRELEMAKSLLSHICHEGTWSEVIATLATKFNKRNQVNNIKNADATKKSTQRVIATKELPRKAIPVAVKRSLLKNANACCEFLIQKTGRRCNSRYQLQIDHLRPIALGGDHQIQNLRILCRTHNLLAARQMGIAKPNFC